MQLLKHLCQLHHYLLHLGFGQHVGVQEGEQHFALEEFGHQNLFLRSLDEVLLLDDVFVKDFAQYFVLSGHTVTFIFCVQTLFVLNFEGLILFGSFVESFVYACKRSHSDFVGESLIVDVPH